MPFITNWECANTRNVESYLNIWSGEGGHFALNSMSLFEPWLEKNFMLQFLVSLFHGIMFLQSGIDKVVDKAGNQEWLKGHFKNSPLAAFVPFLMLTLTIQELISGVLCSLGAVTLLAGGTVYLSYIGMVSCGFTFVALFFGQRLAKDYAGAASLAPYFSLSLLGIILCSADKVL